MAYFNEENRKMDIPIFTDTEAETSMEQDAEEKLQTKVNLATSNAARSLFNITFDDFEVETKDGSKELKDYESKLDQELKDWKLILRDAYNDLKKSKQKHPIVDTSILPPDKRAYLEKAPNLGNFLRDSIEFREEAHIFLEMDYDETMEAVENLVSYCRRRLEIRKAVALAENIANIRRN